MENKVYVFGYSRKSPDDKENTEQSISNQNDLIKLICERNSWELISIEEDRDISGSKEDRVGLIKQVEESIKFKQQHIDYNVYIIVKDSKRFARNYAYSKKILEKLELNKIKVYSITKGSFIDYNDIGDRIVSIVDEQTIYDGKRYAKINEELKISKGLPCIPAPFGYKYDKNKNWVIDNKQSKIVLNVVLDYINSKDYKVTLKDNRINKSKYYRIIKNAKKGLYSGYIVYSKKEKDPETKKILLEEIKYKGSYEPIISEELFNKINEK